MSSEQDQHDPAVFAFDRIEFDDLAQKSDAPPERIEEAKRAGVSRKQLASGEGGFYVHFSQFPAGYVVQPHSHDHDELLIVLEGGCQLSDAGPTLGPRDSVVLRAGYRYGFECSPEGMKFFNVRRGVASIAMEP